MVEMYKKRNLKSFIPPKQHLVPRSTYIAGLPTANWISQAPRALRVHTRLHMRLTEMRRTVDTGFVLFLFVCFGGGFVLFLILMFVVVFSVKEKEKCPVARMSMQCSTL